MTPIKSSVDIAKLLGEVQRESNGIDTCDCGHDCICDTISQNPGSCTCDKKMTEAKAKLKK